ncbi:hypothetical protein [Haliea sp.]|jgi:hypothetical protein|uniref:hypothetical protein n=1 Tax=Haliea TaxID=475794 RepID=UPI000C36DC49|nr:hypothetical protein [Haliea sp.]HBM83031.1 hypothetical protein [Halieaceae bacterium]MAD64953.1 hypothetical protein [Haliea sp.]MAY94595.1 hypothetical protein [Haliea sp.]MBP71600.1 hypothetical protein [Haliea sp.]HBX71527.1 hypothetical protein [Halieaceae bacterium]
MNMRSITLRALIVPCIVACVACGDAEVSQPSGDSELFAGASADAPGSDADSPPRCPAKLQKSPNGPDVAGVALGLPANEALNIVRCHARDAVVLFEDRWFEPRSFNTHQTKLERQVFVAQSGEHSPCDFSSYQAMQRCGPGQRSWDFVAEKIRVATPGLPGKQTVVGVWRTQNFPQGAMPSLDNVLLALKEKYGVHQFRGDKTVNNNLWSDRIELAWITDQAGTPLSEANPLFNDCVRNVNGEVDAGQVWRDGCGLSIAATVLTPRANPGVVGQLSVGLLDQSGLYRYQEAMQDALDQIEETRRRAEVDEARSGDVVL